MLGGNQKQVTTKNGAGRKKHTRRNRIWDNNAKRRESYNRNCQDDEIFGSSSSFVKIYIFFGHFFFCFFFFVSVSVSVRMDGISDRIWLRVHVSRRSELAVGSAGSCHYTASTPETPLNSQPPQTKTLPVSLSFFVAGSRNLDWVWVTSHKNKRKTEKKTMFQTKGDSSSLFVVVPIGFIRLHRQAPICVLTVSKKIAFNLPLDSVELEVVEHFKSRHQKNALDPENEEPRKSQSRQIWTQDLSSFRCCFLSFFLFKIIL